MNGTTLFVGIGSPHGDDQVGWHVADALTERLPASHTRFPNDSTAVLNSPMLQPSQLAIRKASSPADVLDWLDGIDRLVICDACRSGGPPGSTYRWSWPDRAIEQAHCSGSHDLSLASVLKLADQLQHLSPAVVVWGIEVENLEPQNDFSASVAARLAAIVNTIWSDLGHA
jgi:hydrogenase maturation protease